MPKRAKELSAVEIKRLKHSGKGEAPERVAVGGTAGLHMQITPGGAKSWLLRFSVGPKRRELGLGSYPEVSLADAQEKARQAKAQAKDGVDPLAAREQARKAAEAEERLALTYSEAVDGFMGITKVRSEKNRQLMRNRIRTYSEKTLGGHRVGSIDKHAIKKILDPIWKAKPTTAGRLREDMKNVFDWAIGNDHMAGPNPAEWVGNLEFMMPPLERNTTHRPAVAVEDAPRFWQALKQRGGMGSRALEFLILTAARSGEVRGARWDEIDLTRGLWVIPAARMKMAREHRVPLSEAAVGLLKALPREGDLVFPAVRGGPLSDMTLSAAMKRIHEDDERGFADRTSGKPAVPHGLRSTFRQWAAEGDWSFELAETALAHKVGTEVQRAYQRSDLLEQRRLMMEAWAAHVTG